MATTVKNETTPVADNDEANEIVAEQDAAAEAADVPAPETNADAARKLAEQKPARKRANGVKVVSDKPAAKRARKPAAKKPPVRAFEFKGESFQVPKDSTDKQAAAYARKLIAARNVRVNGQEDDMSVIEKPKTNRKVLPVAQPKNLSDGMVRVRLAKTVAAEVATGKTSVEFRKANSAVGKAVKNAPDKKFGGTTCRFVTLTVADADALAKHLVTVGKAFEKMPKGNRPSNPKPMFTNAALIAQSVKAAK